MNCPRCETSFGSRTIGDVQVDECSTCGGLWFDADELRRAKDETDSDLAWMDFELWRHADRFRVSERPVECPRCQSTMVAIEYDTTGVEVDFCTECRAVWLDAGELDKIIAHLTEELLSTDVGDYVRASLNEARELVAGPESFVSEWKDLSAVLRMLQYRLLSENPKLASTLAEFQSKSQF